MRQDSDAWSGNARTPTREHDIDGTRSINYGPSPTRRPLSETKSLFLETAKTLIAHCEPEPPPPPKEKKKKGDGRTLFLGAKSIIRLPARTIMQRSPHAFGEAAKAITAAVPDWLFQFLADDEQPGGAPCDMHTDPRYRDWYGGNAAEAGLSSDPSGPSLDL
jgi:hypothetical protein